MSLVKFNMELLIEKKEEKKVVLDMGVWVMNIISFVGIIMVNK